MYCTQPQWLIIKKKYIKYKKKYLELKQIGGKPSDALIEARDIARQQIIDETKDQLIAEAIEEAQKNQPILSDKERTQITDKVLKSIALDDVRSNKNINFYGNFNADTLKYTFTPRDAAVVVEKNIARHQDTLERKKYLVIKELLKKNYTETSAKSEADKIVKAYDKNISATVANKEIAAKKQAVQDKAAKKQAVKNQAVDDKAADDKAANSTVSKGWFGLQKKTPV